MADPAGLTGPESDPHAHGPRARSNTIALVLLIGQLIAVACLALDVPALAPVAVVVAVGVSGYAIVRHAGLRDPLLEVLLGPAVALCLIGLVSVAQAYLEWWYPRTTVALMLAAGAVASEIEVLRIRAAGRGSAVRVATPAAPIVAADAVGEPVSPTAGAGVAQDELDIAAEARAPLPRPRGEPGA